MANNKPIKIFTPLDIEKYHKGLLSSQERHALEKAALDDPFLADALEGYSVPGINAGSDLAELKNRLAEKIKNANIVPLKPGKRISFQWFRVAAMIVLIVGAGLLAYQLAFKQQDNQSAVAKGPALSEQNNDFPKGNNSAPVDSVTPPGNKSDSLPGILATKDFVEMDKSIAGVEKKRSDATEKEMEVDSRLSAMTRESEHPKSNAFKAAPLQEGNNLHDAVAIRDSSISPGKSSGIRTDTVYQALAKSKKLESMPEERAAVFANKENRAAPSNNQPGNINLINIFRGRVTDATNNAVPFASVTNKEDNVGTYTDARGYFNLASPDSVLNVQVRSLGFNDKILRLSNDVASNRVIMSEDRNLDAVVLSQKKPNAAYWSKTENMKLENLPEPEDGWDNYDSYLANNLRMPDDFKTKQTGTDQVRISFEVNKLGEPVNIKVEKSLCVHCDQEAIRLVKEGPKWKRKKGRTTIAVSF